MPSFLTRIFILLFLLSTTATTFGQNKFLNLGFGRNGICIGNSASYNGIRLNFLDVGLKKINGINITGLGDDVDSGSVVSGVNLGLLSTGAAKMNGLTIGGIYAGANIINGIAIATWYAGGDVVNGVAIAGFGPSGQKFNGLFVGGLGMYGGAGPDDKISRLNGVGICLGGAEIVKVKGLFVSAFRNEIDHLNGVSVSGYNKVNNLRGITFGLLNYAGNNRILKYFPFINFNFRSKSSE